MNEAFDDAMTDLGEPVTIGHLVVAAGVDQTEFSEDFTEGGFQPKKALVFTVKKEHLTSRPANGSTIKYQEILFRIVKVFEDSIFYELTCIDPRQ